MKLILLLLTTTAFADTFTLSFSVPGAAPAAEVAGQLQGFLESRQCANTQIECVAQSIFRDQLIYRCQVESPDCTVQENTCAPAVTAYNPRTLRNRIATLFGTVPDYTGLKLICRK